MILPFSNIELVYIVLIQSILSPITNSRMTERNWKPADVIFLMSGSLHAVVDSPGPEDTVRPSHAKRRQEECPISKPKASEIRTPA